MSEIKFVTYKAKADRSIIQIERGADQLTIAEMYTRKDEDGHNEAYIVGLEVSYTMLVKLDEVAKAVAATLQAYYNLSKLDKQAYDTIMEMFKPFLKRRMLFPIVDDFINNTDKDAWT